MNLGMNFGLVGEPVTVDMPSTGEPRAQTLAKDFDLQIAKATASTSKLVCSFRKCLNDPAADIEIDSVTGLTIVQDVTSPTASQGAVVRDSASQVSVHLDADAFDHLKPGLYYLDLTEITLGGLVILRHTVEIYFQRSAGRRMV